MKKYIILFLVFAFNCKKMASDSETKEEGMYQVSAHKIDEIKNTLAKASQQPASSYSAIDKYILATFSFEEGGSGVFIGPNGEFASVAHVVSKTGTASIFTNRVVEHKGALHFTRTTDAQRVIVKVSSSKSSEEGYFNDFTIGKMEGVQSPAYLSLSKTPPAIDRRLVCIGSPMRMVGRPNTRLEKPIAFPAMRKELTSDISKARSSSTAEGKASVAILEKSLEVVNQKEKVPEVNNYDHIDGADIRFPVVSVGKVYWSDEYKILTDCDFMNGMSGGPIIDIISGQVVALIQRHASIYSVTIGSYIARNDELNYFGAAIGHIPKMH